MTDTSGALILISFPHQLIHALAALQADRKQRNIDLDLPVTIFVWSYRWIDHRANTVYIKIIKELALLNNYQIYHLSLVERIFQFSEYRILKKRAQSLARIFSASNYDSFYFSHDASADHTAQVLMQFLPNAHKICFGDPPGFLFKKYSSVRELSEESMPRLRHRFWMSRLRGIQCWFSYDSAYVAMNMSYTAPYNSNGPIILSKNDFIELVHAIKFKMSGLESQERIFLEQLGAYSKELKLLVLSNLTESQLITRENELKLYLKICHQYCEPGSTIIIKPHIASSYSFILRLKNNLSEYKVFILPEYLRSVPLEMLTVLLTKCKIISVSSASVFLSYLYGKEKITHALSIADIQHYFNENSRQYMMESTRSITDTIQKLN